MKNLRLENFLFVIVTVFLVPSCKKEVMIPTPIISSFTPTTGIIGTLVTINGNHFDETPTNNVVKFNDITAEVKSAAQNTLTVIVPLSASSGPISVTVNNLTATTGDQFTVIGAPTITSFDPVSGIVGAIVKIAGSNFDNTASDNLVKFNGVAAEVTEATATMLTVKVPATATTGTISVTANTLTANSTSTFTVLHSPTITSFSPTSGSSGSSVTITGTNFDTSPNKNTVKFNGVVATVTATTATSLTVTVPATATTGSITITTNTLTATSTNNFTVFQAPTIDSFSPSSGSAGVTVTITGSNFSTTPSDNVVKFNGVSATINTATTTSLSAVVPTNATSGKISITVNDITVTSSMEFTVNANSNSGSGYRLKEMLYVRGSHKAKSTYYYNAQGVLKLSKDSVFNSTLQKYDFLDSIEYTYGSGGELISYITIQNSGNRIKFERTYSNGKVIQTKLSTANLQNGVLSAYTTSFTTSYTYQNQKIDGTVTKNGSGAITTETQYSYSTVNGEENIKIHYQPSSGQAYDIVKIFYSVQDPDPTASEALIKSFQHSLYTNQNFTSNYTLDSNNNIIESVSNYPNASGNNYTTTYTYEMK